MVGLELQRGKEGMREGEYCDTLGATAACTLRLTELALDGNSECGIMGDAWFGSVKAAVALSKKGYKSILQVKTGHGLFPKKFIDDTLKDAPGGVWIVLESVHQQVPLLAIGYRYSTRTTLFFVATKDSGRTTNGNPYEMKYTDDWGNVHVRYVDRPEIISKFFERSNMIDKHNQLRQFELALEKRWLTQNPFFRLHTTILGFNVVDCYKLAEHHGIINYRLPNKEYKMTMTQFAGVLANQLINNVDRILSMFNTTSQEIRSLTQTQAPSDITVTNDSQGTVSTNSTLTNEQIPLSLRKLTDANGTDHHQIAYDIGTGRTGKKRTKTRPCVLCLKNDNKRRLVGFGCYTCNMAFCCHTKLNNTRDCFEEHVTSICRRSERQA
jgi:hypothetical protein